MGIDHLLRSNGLAAEENERFMNYCLIARQPLYYPCMMEFTGEMLAAVNEMLMQSNGSTIRLFPAMPSGDPEYDRLIRRGQALGEYSARYNEYPAWENVSFDKLLARGAFEVSADLEDSRLVYLRIASRVGGRVRITSPYSLENLIKNTKYTLCDNILEFDTVAGGVYEFGEKAPERSDTGEDVTYHTAYTKRKVFIGEDENTEYYRALDSFTRDWYLGNVRMENHSVYKFDFGACEEKKDFSNVLFRTGYGADGMFMSTMGFNPIKELPFTVKRGYGFADSTGISLVDRGSPDEIRRDFAEGYGEAEFLIEAPRGQYELLVISGDEEEESATLLEAVGGRRTGGELLSAGRYQAKLIPVIHEEDGCIRLKISSAHGKKWKINSILVNLYKQF